MSEQLVIPDELRFDLADRLRKSLRYSDTSSQSMAEYLEVSRNTVSNWLNGHTRPRPAELKMWAMRCGVPYEWLQSGSRITAIMQGQASGSEILAHSKRITDPDVVGVLRRSLGHTARTGRRATRSAR